MVNKNRYRRAKQKGLGTLYLIKLTVLITLLMIVNSHLTGQLLKSCVHMLPDILDDVRLYQFFQIFVPIVVVGIQFWIYDRLRDRAFQKEST